MGKLGYSGLDLIVEPSKRPPLEAVDQYSWQHSLISY